MNDDKPEADEALALVSTDALLHELQRRPIQFLFVGQTDFNVWRNGWGRLSFPDKQPVETSKQLIEMAWEFLDQLDEPNGWH